MFYAAATFLACTPPPEPTFSLPCAVSVLTKSGFKVEPYAGTIEAGCAAAVAKYRTEFYPLAEADMKCNKLSDAAIKCSDKYARDKQLDAYVLLVHIGWKLENAGKLNKAWKAQLDTLDKVGDGLLKTIKTTCHVLKSEEDSIEVADESLNIPPVFETEYVM